MLLQKYDGDDKQDLINFNVALKKQEDTLMKFIAAMNVGGDIFIPTTMLEPLKKEVSQKDVEIKDIKKKILENRQVKHLGCENEIKELKSQISLLQMTILQPLSLFFYSG